MREYYALGGYLHRMKAKSLCPKWITYPSVSSGLGHRLPLRVGFGGSLGTIVVARQGYTPLYSHKYVV
jgi:hypothetical protein